MSDAQVTAVLTFYKHDAFFPDALASVLAQTRPADEIVVYDDASPAGHAESLRGLPDHVRVVRLEPNEGIGGVRAIATAAAAHPIVAYLDCDDQWTPTKLERQVAHLQAHPGASSSHSGTVMFHADGRERIFVDKPPICTARELTLGSQMLPSCFVAWRRAILDAGNWSPDRRIAEDWDLEIRLSDRVGPMVFLAEPLMRFRRFEHGNYSGKTWPNALRLGRTIYEHRATIDRVHDAPGMWRRSYQTLMRSHGPRVGGIRGAALRIGGELLAIGAPPLPAI